ncbi:MAG: hypothetical protein ABGW90_08820, partial [Martelella sp.]
CVQNAAKRLKTSRINAMRLVYKFKPDSSGTGPSMTVESGAGLLAYRERLPSFSVFHVEAGASLR